MKKFLTFVLVLAMVMSVSSVALAAETVNDAATLQAAIDSAENGVETTITLTASVAVSADSSITIPAGKVIVIDLAGNDISQAQTTLNSATIRNSGNLTVKDSVGGGKITSKHTGESDASFGKGVYTVVNSGTMKVDSAIIENATEVTPLMRSAIDNNSTTGNAVLTIESGSTVSCPEYIAIRQFANSDSYENSVTVNGGTVTGGKRAIWVHLPGSSATSKKQASLTVSGGTLTSEDTAGVNLAIYVYSYGDSVENLAMNISDGTINGDVALYGKSGLQDLKKENMSVTGGDFNGAYGIYDYSGSGAGYENQKIPFGFVSGGTFDGIWDEELIDPDAIAAEVTNASGDTVYAIGKEAIEEAAEKAAEKSGADKVTVTVTQGNVAFDKDDLPGGVTVKNSGSGNVTVDGTTPDPSFGVVVPTPAPATKPSSGYSGPDLWYIGGNTFGTSTTQSPSKVEIDGVAVPFTMNGSQIVVGCVDPNAHWVKASWGSTTNTVYFTPDAQAFCAQTVIPKTGDMPIWAAIAAFFGF